MGVHIHTAVSRWFSQNPYDFLRILIILLKSRKIIWFFDHQVQTRMTNSRVSEGLALFLAEDNHTHENLSYTSVRICMHTM